MMLKANGSGKACSPVITCGAASVSFEDDAKYTTNVELMLDAVSRFFHRKRAAKGADHIESAATKQHSTTAP